ncbi:hypothetical protein BaRGS_00015991 [Batillaria attramentaria]|uniref:Uncharacterized protein n=1 Tax=Batillaria attramentaria TaxID=370345 RepID=A0ABD0KZL4_9CAEN
MPSHAPSTQMAAQARNLIGGKCLTKNGIATVTGARERTLISGRKRLLPFGSDSTHVCLASLQVCNFPHKRAVALSISSAQKSSQYRRLV